MCLLVDPEADHDAKGDGQLLCSHQSTTDFRRSDFRSVLHVGSVRTGDGRGAWEMMLTIGTIMDTLPTPMPVMNRPARVALGPAPEMAIVWIHTPKMKTPVAMMIPNLRERYSAIKEENKAPTQAPSSRMAVSQPFLDWSALSSKGSYSPMSGRKMWCQILCQRHILGLFNGTHAL